MVTVGTSNSLKVYSALGIKASDEIYVVFS